MTVESSVETPLAAGAFFCLMWASSVYAGRQAASQLVSKPVSQPACQPASQAGEQPLQVTVCLWVEARR